MKLHGAIYWRNWVLFKHCDTKKKTFLFFSILGLFFLVPRVYAREAKLQYFTVVGTQGDTLKLDSGDFVSLAGVYIPRPGEPNYREYLEKNFRETLLNKRIALQTVLKSKKGDRWWYPQIDVVDVYSQKDDSLINLNKQLLKTGMAFFSWEFFPAHEEYQKLEEEAKKNRFGVWKEKENLRVLYVTKRKWKILHYPECSVAKKIKDKDRLEYYVEWPMMLGGRLLGTLRCKYCAQIAKQKEKEKPAA